MYASCCSLPVCTIGSVNVTVSARADQSQVPCGTEMVTVPTRGRIDVVTQSLLVLVSVNQLSGVYSWSLCCFTDTPFICFLLLFTAWRSWKDLHPELVIVSKGFVYTRWLSKCILPLPVNCNLVLSAVLFGPQEVSFQKTYLWHFQPMWSRDLPNAQFQSLVNFPLMNWTLIHSAK